MIFAVFKVMWLRLIRDRGALVLAFILPGFIFAIFAAIFSNASGGSLDLRVSMALTNSAPASQNFAKHLQDSSEFSLSYDQTWTEAEITQRVRLGQDDVGFVIYGDISDPTSPFVRIIEDPSRKVASTILAGQIRQSLADHSGINAPQLFTNMSALDSETETAVTDQSVTYYVGATAILFLLFSAMQGAAISLEERKSGISDRLLIGPRGAAAILIGKFLFLTLMGALQAAVIIAVASIFFSVGVSGHTFALCLACLGAASLAAAIALLVASLSASAAQMNTVSTFIVLLFSAIGGSMVPRFMMPDWLQALGRFTPNHWAIEAFYGILARRQNIGDLWLVWLVLFGGAGVCLCLSAFISHRLMRV